MKELFKKNINFFYKNLPHLYKLIVSIKSRRYKIIEDNILDTFNNTLLYPNSITKDSLKLSENPLQNNLWKKHFFYINPSKIDEKTLPITGKIINKLIDNIDNNSFKFDKDFLPTTTIFGILAGKHIEYLVDKYYFQSLFIYEPNKEFFAISLYFIDYEKLYSKLNNRLFLWINGSIDYYAIEKFYYERIITSTFLNISLTTYNHDLIEDAKNKFNQIKYAKIRGWGSYEDELKGINNHKKNIKNYPILNKSLKLNIPFCVVANGKSLEKNIDFIKKNRDSMIIVSVGTAINPLLEEGIHSDFHIEQERHSKLKYILKEPLKNYKGILISASVVENQVTKLAKKTYLFIREGFTLEDFYYTLQGSSPIVGNSGVAFAANFTNEIYLCGMDLGFRLNQKKHSKNSFYDSTDDIAKKGIKVEGNFSDDIYSDSLLLSSKFNLEKLIENKNLNVFNLSDGVKIKNTIPLRDKNLPKIDKNLYIKQIISTFKYTDKNFSLKLNNETKAILKALELKINNKKELTGIIDFIEDIIKNSKNPLLNTLIKGSLFHILNHFYILSHKLENHDIDNFKQIINKEIERLMVVAARLELATPTVSG